MIDNAIKSGTKGERLMMTGARGLFENLASAPVFIVPCLYQVSSPTQDPTESLLAGQLHLPGGSEHHAGRTGAGARNRDDDVPGSG